MNRIPQMDNLLIKEEEKEEKNESLTNIHHLNDDCMRQIIQYLPIADRLRIERVCKAWKYLSQSSWSSFNKLNFHEDVWGISANDGITINDYIFDKIISLCGKYLTKIDFSTELEEYKEDKIQHTLGVKAFLKVLNAGSRNIEELYIFNTEYCIGFDEIDCPSCESDWRELFKQLIPYGDKIIKFGLDVSMASCNCKEEDFSLMLASMTHLKTLRIKEFPKFSCKPLSNISSESIEEIIVPLNNQNYSPLISMISRVTKLKTLDCHDSNCQNPELLLEALVLHAKNLRTLSLTTYGSVTDQVLLLSCMSKLRFIEKLSLNYSTFVDDHFLNVVAQNCKHLTHLSIKGCNYVGDVGISSITNLPKIRCLDISTLKKVIRPSLGKLVLLEKLNCSYCCELKDEVIHSLLWSAPHLKLLDIRNNFSRNALKNILFTAAKINPNMDLIFTKVTIQKACDAFKNLDRYMGFKL